MEFDDRSETYILEPGDGFPEFMRVRHELRVAHAPWFNGIARGHSAILFVVLGPEHEGRYVALQPRTMASINEQMSRSGMASVVVNLINNSSQSYGQAAQDVTAVGMSVLRRPGDARFPEE
jgi:hypothetical protein